MTAPRSLEGLSHAQLVEMGRRMHEALRKLSNEAAGNLVAFEPGLRAAIGNTNFAALVLRTNEARALLAETADAAPAEKPLGALGRPTDWDIDFSGDHQ